MSKYQDFMEANDNKFFNHLYIKMKEVLKREQFPLMANFSSDAFIDEHGDYYDYIRTDLSNEYIKRTADQRNYRDDDRIETNLHWYDNLQRRVLLISYDSTQQIFGTVGMRNVIKYTEYNEHDEPIFIEVDYLEVWLQINNDNAEIIDIIIDIYVKLFIEKERESVLRDYLDKINKKSNINV